MKERLKQAAKVLKNKYFLAFLLVFGLVYFFWDTSMEATSSAEFCTSCHVMTEVGDTLEMSSHSNLACGDCHVPHDPVDKVMYKAASGLSHIYHNTFDNELPFHFLAKDSTRDVIQERCVECHKSTVSKIEIDHDNGQKCIDCHRQLPHNNRRLMKEVNNVPAKSN